MPKNQVNDLITDQEMAFALLVLGGTMNDRDAAQAAGLNPDTAAYTKAKPRVREYMIEHRAAVQQKLVEQEAEGLRRLNLGRDQVLGRLWEMANMNPQMTRGSIAVQFKALSMIVAMEGFIPDHRASSSSPQRASGTQSTPPLDPSPAHAQKEDEPGYAEPEPEAEAVSAPDEPPIAGSPGIFGGSETTPSESSSPMLASAPDTRVPFSIKKNPFARFR